MAQDTMPSHLRTLAHGRNGFPDVGRGKRRVFRSDVSAAASEAAHGSVVRRGIWGFGIDGARGHVAARIREHVQWSLVGVSGVVHLTPTSRHPSIHPLQAFHFCFDGRSERAQGWNMLADMASSSS